jgi:hypothetical protein
LDELCFPFWRFEFDFLLSAGACLIISCRNFRKKSWGMIQYPKYNSMKTAAIGVRVHSGWGALVAVSGEGASVEILARERVNIIDVKMAGAFQPYHFVEEFALPKAEAHIAKCAALSKTLAVAALRPIADDLQARGYCVAGGAILQGSGRALPPLPQILAAHPLIHTAEGVFFRGIFQEAFEQLELRVSGIREKDLDEQCAAILGRKALALRKKIAAFGKQLGSPWTTDQKLAALAAFLVLESSK